MKRIVAALTLVLAVGAGAARAEDAKALFAQKCAACHGPDGKGGTAMGKKLGAKDLTAVKLTEPEIAATITNGKPPKMTPYKDKLTGAQIQALAKYVKGGLK
jgi:cytochrome c oxidase cbb3-type subunit 3